MFSTEMMEALATRLDDRMVDEIARNVAHAARGQWVKEVGQSSLVTTKRAYMAGLQNVAKRTTGVYVVSLVGRFPMILEAGQDSYDMRTTLLGPSVPTIEPGKKGKGKRKTKKGELKEKMPKSQIVQIKTLIMKATTKLAGKE